MPLISVIVPCYNQARYLDECLQSVLDQTFQDWECIIVNDGSPDHTEEIAKRWVEKDARFRYIYKENGGLSSARNAGLENAFGEWIQFLDCDDTLREEKFEICLNENSKNKFNLIIHNYHIKTNNLIYEGYFDLSQVDFSFQSILLEWDLSFAIPIHCALFRIDLINLIRFDERLSSKEDWLFWIEVFRKDVSVLFIKNSMCFYRNHSEGMTKNEENMIQNQNQVLRYVYDTLEPKLQKILFEKSLLLSERLLARKNIELRDKANDLDIFVNSPSFKIGSYVIKLFKILKNKF